MLSRTQSLIATVFLGGFLIGIGLFTWHIANVTRRSTSYSNCGERLSMINQAIQMYAADHDDGFPLGSVDGRITALDWSNKIWSYSRDYDINGNRQPRDGLLHDPGDEASSRFSYALNSNVMEIRTLSAVAAPDRAILLFEIEHDDSIDQPNGDRFARVAPIGDGAPGGFLDSMDPGVLPVVRLARVPGGRHQDRLNVALANGSIARDFPGQTSYGVNARTAKSEGTLGGCIRSDLPGLDRPCAEGSSKKTRRLTFSLR